jgi:hypothetical protein
MLSLLTCWPALDASPAKFLALPTRDIVVALDFQPRTLVAGVSFAPSLERIGNGGISSAFASTEMISEHIAMNDPCQRIQF